jgi:hypothetical protein
MRRGTTALLAAAAGLALLAGAGLPALAQVPATANQPASGGEPTLTTAQQRELETLFQQVLANPADSEASLRYARAAERYGQIRKALSAYERVSINDPSNTEARAGYQRLKLAMEPPATRFRLSLGVQYETNAEAANSQISPALSARSKLGGKNDGAAVAALRVDDDRQIGDIHWRSRATMYAEGHFKHSSFDYDYFGGETGPVFVLSNGWTVRVGPAAEVGFQGYDFLYYSVGLTADIDFPQPGVLRTVRFGAMRADFTRDENSRDGWIFGTRGELGWDTVVTHGDAVIFEPFVVYYAAQGHQHQDRYWQFGGRLSYVLPVADQTAGFRKVYLIPSMAAEYRPYAGREPLPPDVDKGNRRDWRLNPGLRLVGTYLFERDITAVLGYDYDRSRSNYNSYSYDNHKFSLNFILGF